MTSAVAKVIILSGLNLNLKGLIYGLHNFSNDQSRLVRRHIAIEIEYLAHAVQKVVLLEDLQKFHEYFHKMTNKFTQNIGQTRDNTYHDLKSVI